MEIKQTKTYAQFKAIKGNRAVNKDHLRHLKESISDINMLAVNPIIVDEKFNVIDGQHRLEAAKQLSLPIFYIVAKGNIQTVRLLNATNRMWHLVDYINSYSKYGFFDYEKILEFNKKYGVAYSTAAQMLMFGNPSDSEKTRHHLKSGEFIVQEEALAVDLMKWSDLFTTRLVKAARVSREFLSALYRLRKSKVVTYDEMKEKLAGYDQLFVPSRTTTDYMRELENVINYKQMKKIHLY